MTLLRLGAALLAPLVYLTLTSSAAAILAYGVDRTADGQWNFSILVSRGAQVVLLLSLIPLCRHLGLTTAEIGFARSKVSAVRQYLIGVCVGVAILSIHVGVLVALRVFKPNPLVMLSAADLLSALPSAALTGLLVASMEETIFRGVMQSALNRLCQPWFAAIVASVYFASLHFLKSELRPGATDVHWYSGFEILADAARHMISGILFDGWLALFFAGLFLAALRLMRPNSLALCMGVHTGWVIVIKLARRYTNPDPHVPLARLVSYYDQVIGYAAAAWIALLLLGLIYAGWRVRRTRTALAD